jgi:ketosteroid isomerase-like protein
MAWDFRALCRAGVLLALALMALPVSARSPAPSPEAVVTAFLEAMTQKNRAAAAALLDADAVAEYPFDRSGKTEPGSWRRFAGREAFLANYVDRAFAAIAVIDWTDRVLTRSANGDTVFFEAWGNMRLADGTPYRNRYVVRFDLRRGHIVGLREYLNPVTAAIATRSRTGADLPVQP